MYFVNCNKNTAQKRAKQNRLILVSNYAVCSKEKSKFIKIQVDYWEN